MKTYFLLSFLIVFFISSLSNAQVFKGVSLFMNAGFGVSGWNYNDDYISKMYTGKPSRENLIFGIDLEVFASKYNSTIIETGYRYQNIKFKYNQLNEYGNVTAEQTIYNNLNIFHTAVLEKLKYDLGSWSFYTFGGISLDFKFSETIDMDFKPVLGNSKTPVTGITLGAGTAKAIGRYRIFLDFYSGSDITKTFDLPSGYFRNTELGFRFGFGYYVPNKK